MSEHGVTDVDNKSTSQLWQALLVHSSRCDTDLLSRFQTDAVKRLNAGLKASHDEPDSDIDALLDDIATPLATLKRHTKRRSQKQSRQSRNAPKRDDFWYAKRTVSKHRNTSRQRKCDDV